VAEMHAVSHDVGLTHEVVMTDGRRMTALQVQWELYALADEFCRRGDHADLDAATEELLDEWRQVLEGLGDDPHALADRIDWIAKRSLMEGFVRRDGLEWDSPRLQLIDLQYSDIRPDKGLAARLEQRGRLRRMFTEDEVAHIRRYPNAIAAASWDSVVFDVPGRESLLRVPTLDPLRGTRAHVAALLDASPDVATLIDRLTPDGSR
jgi:hypothetical protein